MAEMALCLDCWERGRARCQPGCPHKFPSPLDATDRAEEQSDGPLAGTQRVMSAIEASNLLNDMLRGGGVLFTRLVSEDELHGPFKLDFANVHPETVGDLYRSHRILLKAITVAIANLKATDLADIGTVAHVIRSLEGALNHG